MFKSLSKVTKLVFGSCIVMLMVLIGTSLAGNIYQAHLLSQSDSRNDRLARSNQNADQANQRLLRQYTDVFNQYKDTVGKNPVGSTPSEAADQSKATSVAGPQGPAGADATAGQVRQAVDAYCAILDRCVGPRGPGGAEGKPGVTGKAGANGKDGAAGATGLPGVSGADGKDGSVGPQGPAGPAGPKGDKGDKGDTGPASTSPVVTNIVCKDNRLMIEYDRDQNTRIYTDAYCSSAPQSPSPAN